MKKTERPGFPLVSADRAKLRAMGIPLRGDDDETPADHHHSHRSAPFIHEDPNVHHIFVYGDCRPDITPAAAETSQSKRAWLLGSRLYSCNMGGAQRAALRLEEAGHAVFGYTMSLDTPDGIHRLLDSFERREYSPSFYERDVVEVVTEAGERVQSFVYHRPEVDQSNPVQGGDWLQHIRR